VADGVKLEGRGIPTATVCSDAFAGAARMQAEGRGLGELPIVEIPHPMHTAPADAVKHRAEAAVDAIVQALVTRKPGEGASASARQPERIALDSDPVALQTFFHEQGWTDGLPVVPPTEAAVAAMLSTVDGKPQDVVGIIPPAMRAGTLEKLAINAVMAGCTPELFPVVVAAVEAVLDDDCRLYGIQTATNNAVPLIIVSGPAVKRLGFNAGGNVFGSGNRANATVGRAVQLILRNVGGDIPGVTDLSTQGQPGKYSFCIAENHAESPWTPLHVDLGFGRDESVVTVIGASAGHNVFTYGCETGDDLMEHFVGAMTAMGHNNVIFPTGPVLVISPEHAGVLARDGWTKEKIREYVFRHARIPLSRFSERTVKGLHHRRSRWFEVAGDPDHIGVADMAADITIVVAGGAGIHSQFVPTSFSYRPVARRIRFRA
jgi:hypothetical protein